MSDLTEAEMADVLLAYTTMVVHAVRVELADVAEALSPDGLLSLLSRPAEESGRRIGGALGRAVGLLEGLDLRLAENWTPPAGRHA